MMSTLRSLRAGWPPMERWWGFRPCTPDEGPLLGASPIPGLWLATGHHRNGVLLAAITAELLADAIAPGEARHPADGTNDTPGTRWLEAFRWDRFGGS